MEEINENQKEDEPKAYYLSRSYQMLIKENYNITSNSLLYDDKLSLMLYANEWFKIPINMHYMKIKLHPYLTIKDDNLINHLTNEHRRNIAFFFLGNLAVMNAIGYKIKKTKVRTILKFVVTVFISSMTTTLYKNFYLNPKFVKKLENDQNLSKYLTLDIDRNLILNGLRNYGIITK